MGLYIKLFLVFVLIIEVMASFIIVKSILSYNKKNEKSYSTFKFMMICIMIVIVLTVTLFAGIFLV